MGAPVQLGRIGYQGTYTHQRCLTDDGRYVIVDDEVDETGTVYTKTHVFNVASLNASFYVGFHSGTTFARDRTLYIKGNLVFQATTGLDCKFFELTTSTRHRWHRLHTLTFIPWAIATSIGAWLSYPYLPSGNIIVSGIEQGLFVLQSPNNFGACTTVEDFELASPGGTSGWAVSGSCTTGSFVVGTPSLMIPKFLQTQPGWDHTALYFAPNTDDGTNDIDGGKCVATSPVYSAVEESNLSAWYVISICTSVCTRRLLGHWGAWLERRFSEKITRHEISIKWIWKI